MPTISYQEALKRCNRLFDDVLQQSTEDHGRAGPNAADIKLAQEASDRLLAALGYGDAIQPRTGLPNSRTRA
ncbi:MAG TPA: hypothetical protein VG848_08145 [Acetobacteraceae bacterium]|nr:hypothetical protein [Acetobacteraceae bacterium]